MDLILDGNGPLYGQLARALKGAMSGGRLPNGSRLPASRDLATDLGLSRTTVVTAYEQLRAEGYLSGKVGSGSYVTAPWQSPVRPKIQARRTVVPQSAFSRRARQIHEPGDLFGRRPADARYAFQFSMPMVNPAISTQWSRELVRALPYIKPNYPHPQGLPALRAAICRHIARTRGVVCTEDDILITAGTQQALSLIARVLLDPGDEVVLEEPHYFGARKILQMHGASVIGVPVDADGLQTAQLPNRAVKLVYVTPSHQFPTGAVLSPERRSDLLEYARQGGGWICEDDYDGEFRHDDHPIEALQSLDRDGRVIYVGSFSKTLFPALRLGYMVLPSGLKDDFVTAKWADDFACSPYEQAALAGLIENGSYDRHLRICTRRLTERRNALLETLKDACGDHVEIVGTHSGMHLLLWVNGMSSQDSEAFVRSALTHQLGLYPVQPCYLSVPNRAAFIMGFSAMSTKDVRDAARIFAQCLNEYLESQDLRRRKGGLVLAHSA